jgi:predicted HNH restriction endonuclease
VAAVLIQNFKSCRRNVVIEFANEPIAPKESFKRALLMVRDKKKLTPTFLALLRYHCEAPDHTTTATRLAEALGLANFGAANLQLGKLAHLIADELEFQPEKRSDGKPMWWSTLASGRGASADTLDAQFEFVMRPELVDALVQMKWAKSDPA